MSLRATPFGRPIKETDDHISCWGCHHGKTDYLLSPYRRGNTPAPMKGENMAQIELGNGYYIEIDESARSYDLKQRYKGQSRDGAERDGTRTIGYYSDIPGALKRFVEINRVQGIGKTPISLPEAIEGFKKADKKIEKLLAGLGVRIEPD